MKGRLILLLLCVFIAGVFFGIWMDWSAWHNKIDHQEIVYRLSDQNEALLEVNTGDNITLKADASADHANNPKIKFDETNPTNPLCASGTGDGNSNICKINDNSGSEPRDYYFTCSSDSDKQHRDNKGDHCDPAVQQSGSPGGKGNLDYLGFVKGDFAHLFGM